MAARNQDLRFSRCDAAAPHESGNSISAELCEALGMCRVAFNSVRPRGPFLPIEAIVHTEVNQHIQVLLDRCVEVPKTGTVAMQCGEPSSSAIASASGEDDGCAAALC